MFFTGDASTQKRVDLGGRSSKERDRQRLLEQTRLQRNNRLRIRQQNSAALKIQKCFRGRIEVKGEQSKVREHFFGAYGKHCQNVGRNCFSPESEFLRQLLFFFKAHNIADFSALVDACRLFQQFSHDCGDVVCVFSGLNYSSKDAVVDYRVKKLGYDCILAVHHNRDQLKNQLFLTSKQSNLSAIILLEAVGMLLDPKLPWACKIVAFLLQKNVFILLRDIILTAREIAWPYHQTMGEISSLENLLMLLISHVGHGPCTCTIVDPYFSFISQILSIPLLWENFPNLKKVLAMQPQNRLLMHQMVLFVRNYPKFSPNDISPEFPGHGCLLGNILESSSVVLSLPGCTFELAIDIAAVVTYLLEALPRMTSSCRSNNEISTAVDDDMDVSDDVKETVLNSTLQQQIVNSIDRRFLSLLMNILFEVSPLENGDSHKEPNEEVAAFGTACAFLYVTLNTLPDESTMIVLAYRTEVVPVLWNYMKKCHENQKWSSFSKQLPFLSGDTPGWILPLAVFCPVYKYILKLVDAEEFYESEKPLSLMDIRCMVLILKQALWHLLWMNPVNPIVYANRENPVELIQHRVCVAASELLSQLQDWNCRRQFTAPSDFHFNGVNEHFISQAMMQNTRASDILKQSPFLVPFTNRVMIFTSQLAEARQGNVSHPRFTRKRIRIRRDHILEDGFSQLSTLSEDDLRGVIRVMFVNEFGAEEAGVDGGGIFKDFIEKISLAAFDVQYGLFKETSDHMLYPNPGSGMIHEQHLQYFHFLGTVLAKAMFEGILVDIPFATFFISKLKNKVNYLHDLPSLDPELHRHLIFLKHYEGDVSVLELYFVVVNNEYGEQQEVELIPGGRNTRVTNDNVIRFIHLMATHHLNIQIRQQSIHFLKGFQQLIQKDWIEMFNEHELQLLISGSLDGLDVDDLRLHTNYAGGYRSDHHVIEIFWDVLKSLSLENQMKFLKFVTGCSRGPLLGFKYLEPVFCIQRAAGSVTDEVLDRLPTSATCMNLLKLPPYISKQQMETKLLYAINADAGFDLS